MVEIHGNTYPHRHALKALGGRWDAARKCWVVPEEKAEEAHRLVPQKAGGMARRGPRVCAGCRCRINYGVYCGKCEFGR